MYLNAYDKYDDGWEGTVYSLNDQNGNIAANNAGNSPDDNANTDASSGWDGTSAEIEVSEAFTVNSLGPNINLNGTTQVGDLFACAGSGASSPKTLH